MLNGYDITDMSNEQINLIMQGIDPEPYNPDKRIESKPEDCLKIRTKIFSAHDPEHLTKTMNNFFDEYYGKIIVKELVPYVFTDKGMSKHCCFMHYIEL